ncbi:MAG TPA: hypothetical protein VF840_10710 [Terriglobales bacterium]
MLTATPRQIRGNAEGAVPSPDGSLVAFHNSSGEAQISVVDTSGENVRVLATAALDENFGKIQWSPDGKKLAFVVFHVGDPKTSIDVIDATGGKRTELTRQENLRTFLWLQNGRIVYTRAKPQDPAGGALHVLDARGNDRRVEIGAGLSVAQMSATLDDRKLAIIRANKQADVYASAIARDGSLSEPRRITLDDRDDRPSGWMPDGDTLLFESNRNGTWDVFRQRLEAAAAEQVAAGPGEQFAAQSVPGGADVLYWSTSDGVPEMRLMRVPAEGGSATMVLQAARNAEFRCAGSAARPESACELAEFDRQKMSVSGFDWHNGTRGLRQELPVQVAPGEHVSWALSPDARAVAVAVGGGVRVIRIGAGESWSAPDSWFSGTVTGVAFRGDASQLVVTTSSARENLVLLVNQAAARKIWASPRQVSSPVISPDGKHLLVAITTESSNAWLVEDF